MKIDDLIFAIRSELGVDFSARQIRYLIAQEVLPAPNGSRHDPQYGPEHLHAARRYVQMREMGLSARQMAQISAYHDLQIGPGISLSIKEEDLPLGLSAGDIVTSVTALIETMMKK